MFVSACREEEEKRYLGLCASVRSFVRPPIGRAGRGCKADDESIFLLALPVIIRRAYTATLVLYFGVYVPLGRSLARYRATIIGAIFFPLFLARSFSLCPPLSLIAPRICSFLFQPAHVDVPVVVVVVDAAAVEASRMQD